MSIHILSNVLLRPVVTEKTVKSGERENAFAFFVNPKATKDQIKRAIKTAFNVDVVKVTTSTRKPTTKKVGKTIGKTKKSKIAFIKLAEGQNLDSAVDNS